MMESRQKPLPRLLHVFAPLEIAVNRKEPM
jgi:hypothetical protein